MDAPQAKDTGTDCESTLPMTHLAIHCSDWDSAFAQQLVGDLPVQGPLVRLFRRRSLRLDRQEEVGSLLLDLSKNGC